MFLELNSKDLRIKANSTTDITIEQKFGDKWEKLSMIKSFTITFDVKDQIPQISFQRYLLPERK